jgi:hypothetical protein
MTVYVDDMRAKHGRMIMCHMIADSSTELVEMASRIGIDPKWIQSAGIWKEHFDVSASMRAKAIAAGAIAISQRDLGRKLLDRKRRMLNER